MGWKEDASQHASPLLLMLLLSPGDHQIGCPLTSGATHGVTLLLHSASVLTGRVLVGGERQVEGK